MTSLHEEVQEWLCAGAIGNPARDHAVHAAFCPACLAAADGLDALRAVDIAGSDEPSRLAVGALPPRRFADLTYVGTAVASVLVIAVVLVVQAWPLIPDVPRIDVDPGRRVAEEVLSGAGAGPSAGSTDPFPPNEAGVPDSDRPSPSDDTEPGGPPASGGQDPIGGEIPQPSPIPAGPDPSTPPPIGPEPTPQPSLPAPPTATPEPTSPPTLEPTAPPTLEPTAPPTAEPTAPPTAPPTVEPSDTALAECSDGIDNDGDGLFDFGLFGDPDCTGPDDDSEAS